ncbi:MAG: putative transcriptional regulator, contains C-terminal domain [Planctomycetota bacterium]|nr:putative transcriptional regulator, contains C-terminal domain [Planctomycetota bacterium]
MSTASQTAADVMTASPRTCSPYSTVLEAVMIFRDADCGAVPVVDGGKPVGVLTDRDVALALAEFPDLVSRSVADIMTKDPITVSPDSPISEVEAKIAANAVRRLLVVDASGALVGIVAWKDLADRTPTCEMGQVVTEVLETA